MPRQFLHSITQFHKYRQRAAAPRDRVFAYISRAHRARRASACVRMCAVTYALCPLILVELPNYYMCTTARTMVALEDGGGVTSEQL